MTSKQQPIPRPRSHLFMAASIGEVDSLQNAVDAFKVGGGRGRSKAYMFGVYYCKAVIPTKWAPVQWSSEEEIFTGVQCFLNRLTWFERSSLSSKPNTWSGEDAVAVFYSNGTARYERISAVFPS